MAELRVMARTYGCENSVDPEKLRVKGGISLSLSLSLSLSYLTNGHYLTYLALF
jgi:hypothetical protein